MNVSYIHIICSSSNREQVVTIGKLGRCKHAYRGGVNVKSC